jgi:competence protein ComEC
LLTLAVGTAVALDPLLVWSVGFWLSVGATAGTVQLGAPAAAAIRGPRWLVVPFCSSFAAQVGVAVPSLIVFGRLPVVSLVANLLAIPVAGAVMLYGLPAGLVAHAVPALAPLVLLPAELGVRWVSVVAALGARAQFGGLLDALGWLLVSAAVLVAVARHRGASAVAWCSIAMVKSR